MDNPIQELSNKVAELYGKLVKLEYELETLDIKKEIMRKDYAKLPQTISAVNQDEGIVKG